MGFGFDPFTDEIAEDIGSEWFFNGVTEEGKYGLAPMEIEKLARLVAGKPAPEDFEGEKQREHFEKLSQGEKAILNMLTPEQQELYYTLVERSAQLYNLQETQEFRALPEKQRQAFKEIIDKQMHQYNQWVLAQAETLYAALPDEQSKYLLKEMLENAWKLADERVHRGELDKKKERIYSSPCSEDVHDICDLSQTGWGIIFPAAIAPEKVQAIEEALADLIALRQRQAGKLYRIYKGGDGYRPNETKSEFFLRHHVGAGLAQPDEMPFYLLLVGSPEEISYEFQYQVDVMRGVGRIDFGDDYKAYRQYARNVVLTESNEMKLARKAAFFAVKNPGDKATELSQKYLTSALLTDLPPLLPNSTDPPPAGEWNFSTYEEKKATHAQLRKLLGGDAKMTPAFLFTASHGMEFKLTDPDRQRKYQGALVCQDWGGPSGGGIKRTDYFAGEDLPADANLLGMVALFFACYGAGTPKMDQFAAQAFKERKEIAPEGFLADLPKQMLLKGALAVIGHVERAWGYSFMKPDGSKDNKSFIDTLRKLLNGSRVGAATDPGFNMRYADISSELSSTLNDYQYGTTPAMDQKLARAWTANNDARGYVVIGDPAVYIPMAKGDEKPTARLPLETVSAPSAELAPGATAQAQTVTAQAVPADLAAANFGLGEQIGGLKESLKSFTDKIAEAVGKATQDITTLEVKTYSTGNLGAITAGSEAGAELRALTHIDFDGDMKVFVPTREGGGVDQDLWQIHLEMVREAQANRAQFIGAMAEMAASLLKSLT